MNEQLRTKELISEEFSVGDLLRVPCIIIIMMAHAGSMYTHLQVVVPAVPSAFLQTLRLNIEMYDAVPVFFMLSGLVFGYGLRNNKYQKLLPFVGKKAYRLLVPYFAWGFLTVAPVMIMMKITDRSFLDYCLWGIVEGFDSRHLWYLQSLFVIFIVAFLFRKVYMKWNPVVLMAIFIAMAYIPAHIPGVPYQVILTAAYIPYFSVGVLVDRYYPAIRGFFCKAKLFWILTGAVMVVTFPYTWSNWWINIAQEFVICAFFLQLGILLVRYTKIGSLRLVKAISKNSYTIYLGHAMIIYLIYYFFGQLIIPAIPFYIGSLVVSGVLSCMIGWLLKKMHLGVLIGA